MSIRIVRSTERHYYGDLTHNEKEYQIIFGHPITMLEDNNISFKAKGVLAFCVFVPDKEIDIPDEIFDELMTYGYIVEVI
jgi:hypothetical protein